MNCVPGITWIGMFPVGSWHPYLVSHNWWHKQDYSFKLEDMVQFMVLQRTEVQFPEPMSEGSQPFITPAQRIRCPLWTPQALHSHVHTGTAFKINPNFKEKEDLGRAQLPIWDWRDGSVVKSIRCSSIGLEFGSCQHHGQLTLPVTQAIMALSYLHRQCPLRPHGVHSRRQKHNH